MDEIRLDASPSGREDIAAPSHQPQIHTWSSRLSDVITRLADAADSAQESSHTPESRRPEEPQHGRAVRGDDLDGEGEEPEGGSRQPESHTPRAGSSLGGILRQFSNRGDGGGAQPGGQETSETAAAAAERHRLTGSSLFDIQAASRWVDGNTVFVIILLVIFLVQHIAGCLLFVAATLFFTALNLNIKRQVSRKDAKSRGGLLGLVVVVLGQACLLLWPFHSSLGRYSLSWKTLFLQLPQDLPSVWDTLYLATLTDVVSRLLTAAAKLIVLFCVKATPDENFQRRGRMLNAVEHVSILYRVVVTTPIWLFWLHQGSFFRFIMTYVYLGCKLRFSFERLVQAGKACKAAWSRHSSEYGRHLEADDLLELGGGSSCAICQDPMTRPLQLQCKHAFCEACITEWLERELTCPMCRTQVKAPGNEYKSGSISLFPQIL